MKSEEFIAVAYPDYNQYDHWLKAMIHFLAEDGTPMIWKREIYPSWKRISCRHFGGETDAGDPDSFGKLKSNPSFYNGRNVYALRWLTVVEVCPHCGDLSERKVVEVEHDLDLKLFRETFSKSELQQLFEQASSEGIKMKPCQVIWKCGEKIGRLARANEWKWSAMSKEQKRRYQYAMRRRDGVYVNPIKLEEQQKRDQAAMIARVRRTADLAAVTRMLLPLVKKERDEWRKLMTSTGPLTLAQLESGARRILNHREKTVT